VRIALSTAANGHSYRLRNASFDVNGPTHVTLSSETDPAAVDLVATVTAGSYVVTLADGWQLEREDLGSPMPVQATLVSPNPTSPLTVTAGRTTSVVFQFTTDGVPITLGSIDIGIQVTEVDAGTAESDAGSAPRVALAVDPLAIVTELGTTHTVNATITAADGFSGTVLLAGRLVGTAGATLDGWGLSLDGSTINLPLNGSATIHATVVIPTLNRGLGATVTFVAAPLTPGVKAATAITTINVANQYTIDVSVNADGQCIYPPAAVTHLNVGTVLRWLNTGTVSAFVIHTDGNSAGCPHQSTGAPTAPGATYDCTLSGASAPFAWYCHSPGPEVTGLQISAEALP
jgi:hypothetical protein